MKLFPYDTVGPAAAVNEADKILNEYFQITGKLGIRACLIYGLCLGFVRDGAYLAVDNDLDVAAIVNEEEWIALTQTMIRNGYEQKDVFPLDQHTHFVKNRILIDIYWRKAKGFYAQFETVRYKGKMYSVPYPIDKYLTAVYSNWRVDDPGNDGKVYEY